MKTSSMAAAAALFLFAAPGFAEDQRPPPDPTTATATDNSKAMVEEMSKVTAAKDFVTLPPCRTCSRSRPAQMAKKQAASNAASKLGQMLVKDHSASSTRADEARQGRAKLDVKPPAALDQRHQVIVDSLKDAKGAGFDTAFAQAQVQAHQEAIALFEAYGKNGDNAELKAFANQGPAEAEGTPRHGPEGRGIGPQRPSKVFDTSAPAEFPAAGACCREQE